MARTEPLSEELRSIRAEVLREVDARPDLGYGLYHLAAAYVQLALVVALVHLVPAGVLWKVALAVAMGLTQYRLYFPLHEACHGTLLPNARANRFAGRLTAGLLASGYQIFTDVHMQHHRLFGRKDDPGAVDYYVHFGSRWQMVQFFLWPLLGLSIVEKVWTNLGGPVRQWLARRAARDESAKPGERRGHSLSPADGCFVVAAQGVLFLGLTGLGAHPMNYVYFYLLPAATVFLFLMRLRMYLEHGPLDYSVSDYFSANSRTIARTHATSSVISTLTRPLMSYMNFHFHREHHIWPSMPSCRLPLIHTRYLAGKLHVDDDGASYAASVGKILRLGGRSRLLPSAAAEGEWASARPAVRPRSRPAFRRPGFAPWRSLPPRA